MITDNGLLIVLFFPALTALILAGVLFMFEGFSRILDGWF